MLLGLERPGMNRISRLKKQVIKRGRTQPFLTGFMISGGSTEGSLGGLLAQRQAALREVIAAGSRINFPLVYRACRLYLEHVACQEDRFLENRSDCFLDWSDLG